MILSRITPRFFSRQSVAARVLLLILLCGLFFAVAETCVQLYLDYRDGLEDVEDSIQMVRNSHLKSITKSVWNLETDEVALQLEGVLKLKNIKHLKVVMENNTVFAHAGTLPSGQSISKKFPLTYRQYGKTHLIGELHITISIEELYHRLYKKMLFIMISRIFLTLCLSGIFLFIFQHIVSRHLTRMAEYTQSLDVNNLGPPLVLNRHVSQKGEPDELEKVAHAINNMQAHLRINISEIKETQAALKENENKYRSLFESSRDAILLLNMDTGFIDCNRAALDLFGIQDKKQLSELKPIDLSPRFQPDKILSSQKAQQMIDMVIKHGSHLFEWTHKRLNGEEFFASVLITRLVIDERTILQGVVRDITDQKRSQEMLIQSEKMMSVGGLAAGMAHEINNPLAGMLQNTEVLSNRLTITDLPANVEAAEKTGIRMTDIIAYVQERKIETMLTAIKESGNRMASLVENMLSFARKADDAYALHNPCRILDKSLDLAGTDFDLKKQYDFKSINIQKDYDENTPEIPCEYNKIQQVFLNIFRNGAQEMQKAGIRHPAFFITTVFEKESNTVRIEIGDNGPGMSKETLKRAFEPFYTTKPVGSGTGLGLSISYFIITENHGGEMAVESLPGEGANFVIRLPAADHSAADMTR